MLTPRFLFVAVILLSSDLSAQSKAPQPSGQQQEGRQPQIDRAATQTQPSPEIRGSDSSPLVVKVLTTPKTEKETTEEQAKREDESAANWWMVRLTGIIGLLTAAQIYFNSVQARRLKET